MDIYDFRVMVVVVDNVAVVDNVVFLPDEGDHSVIETLQ